MIHANKTEVVVARFQEALEEAECLDLSNVRGIAGKIRKARIKSEIAALWTEVCLVVHVGTQRRTVCSKAMRGLG